MRSWRNLARRSSIETACRMTLALLWAVYGNLLRCIQAFSKCGTLFTVSKRPRKRMGRTGRLKVSRKAYMKSKSFLFSDFSPGFAGLLSASGSLHCHFWNVLSKLLAIVFAKGLEYSLPSELAHFLVA